jgi:hypothetical protein
VTHTEPGADGTGRKRLRALGNRGQVVLSGEQQHRRHAAHVVLGVFQVHPGR